MQSVPAATMLERLGWRYATKKFDATRKIPAETWEALERALVLSPSSFGLQPWRFVVVENPDVRAALRPFAWDQPQVMDASHLVVFARRLVVGPDSVERHLDRVSHVRAVPRGVLEEYRKAMLGSLASPAGLPGGSMEVWTRSQVYIALGMFLSACAMMGVDSCPMEGFNPAGFDQVLGLKEHGYASVVAATAGYRASDDVFATFKKVRFDPSELIVRV